MEPESFPRVQVTPDQVSVQCSPQARQRSCDDGQGARRLDTAKALKASSTAWRKPPAWPLLVLLGFLRAGEDAAAGAEGAARQQPGAAPPRGRQLLERGREPDPAAGLLPARPGGQRCWGPARQVGWCHARATAGLFVGGVKGSRSLGELSRQEQCPARAPGCSWHHKTELKLMAP